MSKERVSHIFSLWMLNLHEMVCVCVGGVDFPSGQRGDEKGQNMGFHKTVNEASYQTMFIEWGKYPCSYVS